MPATDVIAIFDIGRTHKKFMLFDLQYRVVAENSTVIPDITDEDGYGCEDVAAIEVWMRKQLEDALNDENCVVKALNFSAHGASMVHLDADGHPVTPLYDYMKPLDPQVTADFYALFGGPEQFSRKTGSPVLDMLNSGIQLYWLKRTRPEMLAKVAQSLHLPQYGNYLFSGKFHADITSIGCHTGLWDVDQSSYHQWLSKEGLDNRLPAPEPATAYDEVSFGNRIIPTGIGLHDSSAALLPFVYTASEPFLLLSSGTWNITLNPFFAGELSDVDYRQDCLYFLLDADRKVAASRLFLGNEYQHQVRRLEEHYQKAKGYYVDVRPDESLFRKALQNQDADTVFFPETMAGTGPFPNLRGNPVDLGIFPTFEEAYHKLMLDLTYLQKVSIELLCRDAPVRRLYVSGGFLQSQVFMELLCAFLPGWEVCIAENKRASALGAAVALHKVWQPGPLDHSVSPVLPFQPTLHLDLHSYQSFFEPHHP